MQSYECEQVVRGKPLDVQVAPYIPALPLETAPPMRVLAGAPMQVKTMWDLSAWVRACESEHAPARWLYKQVISADHIDSRLIGQSRPGVVLVLADEPTLDCYHGGGKLALANSRAKAPNGWRFCLSMLPPSAQNALETWVSSGALPADIAGYAKSAPASSWSELTMSSRGLFGAYASDLLTWE